MRYSGNVGKISILFIPIILLLIIAVPAMAISYYASILVQETAGTDYGTIGLIESMNINYMADEGFANSDGRDIQIMLGAMATKRMLAEDKLLFVDDVTPHQSDYYTFSTNNTVEDFSIITGYGGYVTTSDHTTIEIGDDGAVSFDTIYLDTTANTTIFEKPNAWEAYTTDDGYVNVAMSAVYPVITSNITGSNGAQSGIGVSMPSNIESGDLLIAVLNAFGGGGGAPVITTPSGWTQLDYLNNFTGGNVATYGVYYKVATGTETTTNFTTNVVNSNAYQVFNIDKGSYSGTPSIGVRATGNSANPDPPLNAGYSSNATMYMAISASIGQNHTAAPASYVGFLNILSGGGASGIGTAERYIMAGNQNPGTFTLSGAVPWVTNTLALKGIAFIRYATSGEKDNFTASVNATSGNLEMWIDGVNVSSITRNGISVPNTSSNYTFLSGVPYCESVSVTVNGTRQLYYAPNDIISGDILPDREATGGLQNGSITWGTNPVSVNIQTGYLEFDESMETGQDIGTPDSVDVLNAPENMSHQDSDMTMPYNIFYFLVKWLSDVTDIDVVMIWWWISAALSIGVLVLARRFLNSIWVAGFLSAIVSAAFVAMGTTTGTAGAGEFWMPVVIIIATAFTGIWLKTTEAG